MIWQEYEKLLYPTNKNMKFKKGDKVRDKLTKQTRIVKDVPGDMDYDRMNFISEHLGMTLEDGGWRFQKEFELVRGGDNMKFKVGDRVKIIDSLGDDHQGQIGILEAMPSKNRYWVKLEHSTCYCAKIELVSQAKGGNMRKRYILLKETYHLKKGAIFEEQCDDGTQDFDLITRESYKSKKSSSNVCVDRDLISNPKWFEEVVPFYVPSKQVARVKKILKLK